jgi:hypothetical protein
VRADDASGVGRNRGQQHDPPEAALLHAGEDPPCEQERRAQVHGVEAVPLLERDLLDPAARRVDAGVGDQDADRPEPGLGGVDERIGGGRVGEVGPGRDRAAAEAADRRGGLFGRVGARGVRDDDVVAVLGEPQRDGAADPARGAGDERDRHAREP